MWIQRLKWPVLGTGLLLASCLLLPSLWVQADQAPLLPEDTPVLVAAASIPVSPRLAFSSVISTPVPTLETVSHSEMLGVYKEVLETTENAVESSHKALELYLRWTTIILGVLTAGGVGGLYLIWRSVGEVQGRANELRIELENTRKLNEELNNLANEHGKMLAEQSKKTETLTGNLTQLEKGLADAKKQASLMLSDLESLVPRLRTLANVAVYAMRLFSTNNRVSRTARRTLVELSKDNDPVVRRECVRVFGAMADYPECFTDLQNPLIISCLQEMALKDPERGVRLEASLTLNKLGVDSTDEQQGTEI